MANELRGFRFQGGPNVTTVTPAEPVQKPEQPANNIKPEPAPKVEEPVKKTEPKPETEKMKEPFKKPEPAPKIEEEVKQPEDKIEEPVKQPKPAPKTEEEIKQPENKIEEPIKPEPEPKIEKEEPKPYLEKEEEPSKQPKETFIDRQENMIPKAGIDPIKKLVENPPQTPVDNSKAAELISKVAEKGGKKHNNFNKNALPFILGALAIGGIAWLISSLGKKKKEEKVAKNNEPKKEPDKKLTAQKEPEKKEPEKKEPEKEAENKENEMSTISYSVEYDNASSKLSDKEQKKLDALNKATAQLQKDKGDRTIVVASGASKNGTEQINQKFSDERTGVAVDSLKKNGATNIQIAAGVGERAATLESTSKDGHAGSKADRVSVVNAGLVTKADAEYWSGIARKELETRGFTQGEIDDTLRKSIQNDKVIDLKYADTREAKNVLAQLEKENEPYRNILNTEYGLVQKHTRKEDLEALASKNLNNSINAPVQNVVQVSSDTQKPESASKEKVSEKGNDVSKVSDASKNGKEETVKLKDKNQENDAANKKEPEKNKKENVDKKTGEKTNKELPKTIEDKLNDKSKDSGKKKLTDLGKEVEGTKKKKENAKSTSKQR